MDASALKGHGFSRAARLQVEIWAFSP